MTSERTARELLPDAVAQVIEEFHRAFGLEVRLWLPREGERHFRLHPRADRADEPEPGSLHLAVPTTTGAELLLELRGPLDAAATKAANVLRTTLERIYEYAEEVRFFTYEVSERYEEINLLYSISETLGSLLRLNEAAVLILAEVCDVLGARRGTLWVHSSDDDTLHAVASVGDAEVREPLALEETDGVTGRVFREGKPVILGTEELETLGDGGSVRDRTDSILSVPIRYTPPSGEARTVGVINLVGRRRGGRFTASDQRLLLAIASQVGAALENNRLVRESLEQERMSREMELAHDLQMKLLPAVETLDPGMIAARVQPAESVGGDFYHFFRLPGGRFGVMIGDVSSHGFPAALIMALSLSAASIYVSEVESPDRVLSEMSQALRDELETTEMYLTLFYAVIDPAKGELVYANAGHPHAFAIRGDGTAKRLEALDLPIGIAPEAEFRSRCVPWSAGEDLLLLFTDGLSDTLVADSRTAGEQRVVSETVRRRDRSAGEIVEALFALDRMGPLQEGDDRTALVLRV